MTPINDPEAAEIVKKFEEGLMVYNPGDVIRRLDAKVVRLGKALEQATGEMWVERCEDETRYTDAAYARRHVGEDVIVCHAYSSIHPVSLANDNPELASYLKAREAEKENS